MSSRDIDAPVTILLADDYPIMRDGLEALLTSEPNLHVITTVGDGHDAVAEAGAKSPDVVLMDVSMPRLDGIEATRQILAENPDTIVVCISMHSDRRTVVAALDAGAKGYVLKRAAFDELLGALTVVLDGGTYLSPSIPQIDEADLGLPT